MYQVEILRDDNGKLMQVPIVLNPAAVSLHMGEFHVYDETLHQTYPPRLKLIHPMMRGWSGRCLTLDGYVEVDANVLQAQTLRIWCFELPKPDNKNVQ